MKKPKNGKNKARYNFFVLVFKILKLSLNMKFDKICDL